MPPCAQTECERLTGKPAAFSRRAVARSRRCYCSRVERPETRRSHRLSGGSTPSRIVISTVSSNLGGTPFWHWLGKAGIFCSCAQGRNFLRRGCLNYTVLEDAQ